MISLLFLPATGWGEGAPSPETPPAAESQNGGNPTWKEQLEKKHVEFVEWLQANYPEKAADLLTIRSDKPEAFVQQLGDAMKIYEPIQKAERYSPELANALRKDLELQAKRDHLLKEISRAGEEQRAELHKHLKDVVSARFDIIIQKKQLYYDQLRQRLERIKQKLEEQAKELEKLKAEKDQSVEQRIKDLLEGAETLDW